MILLQYPCTFTDHVDEHSGGFMTLYNILGLDTTTHVRCMPLSGTKIAYNINT